MRQLIDTPVVASSQMSNNRNESSKHFVRDRDKIPAAIITSHSGSGRPWSLYEEQSLVVLVHDLGPNWGLVADALNTTLHFKCIFRNPEECKERHKQLMDVDGAHTHSARDDDSFSCQPYGYTLPGIPIGNARQLFQPIQAPLEEDTMKSHFEKIIMIDQKLRGRT